MKKCFVLVSIVISSFYLQAQNKSVNNEALNYNNYQISNGKTSLVTGAYLNSDEFKRNENYLFDKWENNATIVFKNEEVLIKNINFDALRGKFVSQISTDSVFVFYNLDKVFILGKTFININNKYYQSLDSSNPNNGFLKEYYIKEIKPEVHVISNKVLKPGEKKLMYKYYMYLNNTLTEINLKKKDILNVFNLKKEEIINFVKKNKLSYHNEEHVLKIYTFYNSLLIN
jgi:hypothetical protein